MAKKPYYITTAIAYASGTPHIGNTYEAIMADAIARFKRYQGYDVFFQTGTDEHGQKIEGKAFEAEITPKEFVDRTAGRIRRIWDSVNTSYDKFIRTTDDPEDFPENVRQGRHLQEQLRGNVLHALRVVLDGIAAGERVLPGLRSAGEAGEGGGVLL